MEIEITTGLIVTSSIAARDFEKVLPQPDKGSRANSRGLCMNILTTNALVGRFVTDWTGPSGELKRVNIQIGVPSYPGDTMVLTGTVSNKRIEEGIALVDIQIVGKNRLGDHVTGVVIVTLPLTSN